MKIGVMDSDISDVFVSEYLQSKLTNIKNSHEDLFTGYIIGWHEDGRLSCIDCVLNAVYFPEGIDVIGAFCLLNSQEEYDDHFEDIFDKHQLISVCEKVPTIRVILFVYGESDDYPGKAKIKAMLYSEHSSSLLEPVPCIYQTDDCLTGMLFRANGHLPLLIEAASDSDVLKENLASAFEKLKNVFTSGTPAFHLQDTDVLLHSSSKDMECRKLLEYVTHDENSKKKKSKDSKKLKVTLNFKILMQSTGEPAIGNAVGHSLVIHCQRRDFICISLRLPMDLIVFTPENSQTSVLYNHFVNASIKQLVEMESCLLGFCESQMSWSFFPQPYHFFHHNWEIPITIVYPSDKNDDELEPYRRELHAELLLPMDRPLLRKKNRHSFPDEETDPGYLKNPHVGLPPPGIEDGETALVFGVYSYHHYMQDHVNDDGWGCAYRSLQTIISWFRHQGYTDTPVPTHTQIQQALVDVGDKPQSFVGSRQWIGSQEVSYCLDKLIGVTSKIMFVSSGAELANKGRELVSHFRSQGTPIMIGGGVLAHTIIGVDFNQHTGDLKFLILDPHYTGSEDLQIVQNKGWCGWKGVQFWDPTAFYNLCLPQCPQVI